MDDEMIFRENIYTFNTIDDIDLDISLNPNVITSPNEQTCSEFHQRKRSLSCSEYETNFFSIRFLKLFKYYFYPFQHRIIKFFGYKFK